MDTETHVLPCIMKPAFNSPVKENHLMQHAYLHAKATPEEARAEHDSHVSS